MSKEKKKVQEAEVVETKKVSKTSQFLEKTGKVLEQNIQVLTYEEDKKSAESMLSKAIESGASIETVEKVMAMRRELKAEFAKEQFDFAMSQFQAECPDIKKTKAGGETKSGEIAYYYATIGSIVQQVKPLLGKFGLSYAIKTEIGVGTVKSICIVKHNAGHSEQSEMEVPLGTKTGVMSNSQVTAATSTFSKRYAFMNAFGIMTGDDDEEKNLKDEVVGPADGNAIKDALDYLEECVTDEKVLELWNGFSTELKKDETIRAKVSERRTLIAKEQTNENS